MDIGTILSIILGVGGIITGLFFYLLGKRKKEPVYIYETTNLISDEIAEYSGLEILYNKKKVKNLSIGKMMFWNKGKEPIRKEDLSTLNRLSLKFSEEVKIHYSSIIVQSSISNQIELVHNDDKNELYLQFDYLNHNQGAVFIFVYEANPKSKIILDGDIVGVEKIERKKLDRFLSWTEIIKYCYLIILIPLTFIYVNLVKDYKADFLWFLLLIFLVAISTSIIGYFAHRIGDKQSLIGIPKILYEKHKVPLKNMFK